MIIHIKSIRNIFLLSMLTCCFSFGIFAQQSVNERRSDFWQNVRFGGGIGLSFGDGFFSGTLVPSAIYEISPFVGMGVGLNLTYNTRKNFYRSTIFGGSLIALFNPIAQMQLSAEFEELNVNRNFDEQFVTNTDDNYWYSALFLGAGYRTGNVIFGIRYDVLYDEEKSIYAEPWIPFVRVFF